MKNHKSALNTFSIGFPEKRFDESEWAKKVADLYGLRNNTNILDADIIEYWNDTTWFNDSASRRYIIHTNILAIRVCLKKL